MHHTFWKKVTFSNTLLCLVSFFTEQTLCNNKIWSSAHARSWAKFCHSLHFVNSFWNWPLKYCDVSILLVLIVSKTGQFLDPTTPYDYVIYEWSLTKDCRLTQYTLMCRLLVFPLHGPMRLWNRSLGIAKIGLERLVKDIADITQTICYYWHLVESRGR